MLAHLAQAAPPEPAGTVVRLLLFVAGAAAAGIALWQPITGDPGRAGRFLAGGCAVAAIVAGVDAVRLDGAPAGLVVLGAAGLVALPALLGRPAAGAAAGAVTAGALGAYAATGPGGGYRAAALVLAAAVWLGAGAVLLLARPVDRGRLLRRVTPPAGLVAAVTAGLLVPSAAGLVMVAGAAAVAAAAWSWWRRRPVPPASRSMTTVYASGVVVAALVGAAVAAIGPPTGSPAAGVPLLSRVTVGGDPVPVLVFPHRPGRNLVHIGTAYAAAGPGRDRLAAARPRPGTDLGWVDVELPAGRSTLWISVAGGIASLPVDTGQAAGGPAGAASGGASVECASAALGALVAGAVPPATCPADRLAGADADALRAMVGFIAARGVDSVALAGDTSPRGRAATAQVRSAAEQAGLAVRAPGPAREPLLVVSGFAGADAVLRDVAAGRVAAEGTYLAPWLLAGPLLRHPAGQLLPLRFPPGDPPAVRYLAELAEAFPGATATAVGYAAWLDARGDAAGAPVRLYAASRMYVPGTDHAAHQHDAGGPAEQAQIRWLPDGAIVAVSGPLDPA